VNNAESALQSISFPFRHRELFTGFILKNGRSEQVCFVELVKKSSAAAQNALPPKKRAARKGGSE
jgi:hypothetical protein